MVIDWNRGKIDFSKPGKAAEFSVQRLAIGIMLSVAGLILGGFMVLSIVHEFGHALGAWFTGGGADIHWTECWTIGGNFTFIRIAGPFGGLLIWSSAAWLLTRRHPEISAFCISYTVAETFSSATQVYSSTADLYQMPLAAGVLLALMIVCVIIYMLKLTGGFSYFVRNVKKKI